MEYPCGQQFLLLSPQRCQRFLLLDFLCGWRTVMALDLDPARIQFAMRFVFVLRGYGGAVMGHAVLVDPAVDLLGLDGGAGEQRGQHPEVELQAEQDPDRGGDGEQRGARS